MSVCEDDFDCNGTLVCYTDVPWSDNPNFCACSTFYGWTGDNCDEFGLTAIYYISAASVILSMVLFFLLVAIWDLRIFIKLPAARDWNNTVVTFTYASLGLVFYTGYHSLAIASLASPSYHTVKIETNSVAEKLDRFGLYERVFIMLSFLFSTLAAMNISLMWLEVASRIQTLRKEKRKDVYKYKPVIRAVQAVFVLIVIVSVSLGKFYIAFLISIPVALLMAISYVVGRRRFSKVLEGSELKGSSGKEYNKLAVRVKRTSLIVLITLFSFFVSGGAYVAFSADWRYYSPEGQISLPVLTQEILQFFFAALDISVFWYAHNTLNDFYKSKTSSQIAADDSTKILTTTSPPSRLVPGSSNDIADKVDEAI